MRVREGSLFTCHGDGVCCSDVHGLGPLFEDEVKMLRVISEDAVMTLEGEPMLSYRPNGDCLFCSGDKCEIHAALGGHMKPEACRQFPFVLTDTNRGLRVSTEHRCPCRTLGERAPLDLDAVMEALGEPDRTAIRPGVRIANDTTLDVADWEELERAILADLASGKSPEEALLVEPFQNADTDASATLMIELLRAEGSDRFSRALYCCGVALDQMQSGAPAALPECGWQAAFDRAEARTEVEGDPEAMIRDWVADELWSLSWAFRGSFAQARVELVTRVALARFIAARRVDAGARSDRATAEAIAIMETVGGSEDWSDWIATLPFPDEPAIVREAPKNENPEAV